jgi:hypothetical protein
MDHREDLPEDLLSRVRRVHDRIPRSIGPGRAERERKISPGILNGKR